MPRKRPPVHVPLPPPMLLLLLLAACCCTFRNLKLPGTSSCPRSTPNSSLLPPRNQSSGAPDGAPFSPVCGSMYTITPALDALV
ncbi:hypothetical protein B0T19DRAFT_418211 [Cercophora scortea]|uniref:Secreted protein n=1 Tax=Cercophora scortea TaxID=314031 RepID=A0AAE0MJ16_9PEZI|nr:hypothetical protein B0T19DRAFT_418211 [Cercophora scortea]